MIEFLRSANVRYFRGSKEIPWCINVLRLGGSGPVFAVYVYAGRLGIIRVGV
jgi:hypothetical protein